MLFAEPLEKRQMLAGDVTASVSGGVLTITGDNVSNNIAISAGANAGEVVVSGATTTGTDEGNTLVNGQADAVTFTGVTDDIVVQMNEGFDKVVVTDLDIAGDFRATLGAGNDSLIFRSAASMSADLDLNGTAELTYGPVHIGGDVRVFGGFGNDRFVTADARIDGDLEFFGGAGNDQVAVSGSVATNGVGDDVTLDLGTGENTVNASNFSVGGDLSIDDQEATAGSSVTLFNVHVEGDIDLDTSDFNDTVVVQGSTGVDAQLHAVNVAVDTGAGDDSITVRHVTAGTLDVSSGTGHDTVLIANAAVSDTLQIRTWAGRDTVTINDVEVAHLRVDTGSGNDLASVKLNNVDAVDAVFNTGAGTDTLSLNASHFSSLRVNLGNGRDTAVLTGVTVDTVFEIDGGNGIDVFTDDLTNVFPTDKVVKNF